MGVDEQLIKFLENADQLTIAILAVLFCIDVVLTAFATIFGKQR
jgi:hypothetical protein